MRLEDVNSIQLTQYRQAPNVELSWIHW